MCYVNLSRLKHILFKILKLWIAFTRSAVKMIYTSWCSCGATSLIYISFCFYRGHATRTQGWGELPICKNEADVLNDIAWHWLWVTVYQWRTWGAARYGKHWWFSGGMELSLTLKGIVGTQEGQRCHSDNAEGSGGWQKRSLNKQLVHVGGYIYIRYCTPLGRLLHLHVWNPLIK